MRRHLKKLGPVYTLYRSVRRSAAARRFQRQFERSERKRIVVGASGMHDPTWIPTEAEFLNLLRPEHWQRFFQPASLEAILAEHVWEHLTQSDAAIAASTCFQYLRRGGYLRVAVPDGLHPDPDYIEQVRVGGSGSGADDHKVLYTHETFSEVFEQAGFRVQLYEYFDRTGEFHFNDWGPEDGMIRRSRRFDRRNADGQPHYTSIVLDAFKDA